MTKNTASDNVTVLLKIKVDGINRPSLLGKMSKFNKETAMIFDTTTIHIMALLIMAILIILYTGDITYNDNTYVMIL